MNCEGYRAATLLCRNIYNNQKKRRVIIHPPFFCFVNYINQNVRTVEYAVSEGISVNCIDERLISPKITAFVA